MPTLAARLFAAAVALVAGFATQSPTPAPQTPTATPPFAMAWSRTVAVPGQPRLAVGGSFIFLSSAEAGLTAYAPTDGAAAWSTTLTSDLPPVATGDIVVMLTARGLAALDQQSGAPRWEATIEALPTDPLLQATRRLILAGVGESGSELRAWGLDGRDAWRRDLGGAIVTPIAGDDQVLFVGVDTPAVVALEAATGAVRWRLPLPARPTSLLASGDRLYLSGADAALYAFRQTGEAKPAWRYRLLDAIGQPVAGDRHVYFTLIDNTVRALDLKGGSQRWSRPLPSRPAAGPILLGNALVVPLTSGRVAYLATKDGALAPATQPDEATSRLRLQAVALSADGVTVYTVAAAGDDTRTLAAWRRPPPKA